MCTHTHTLVGRKEDGEWQNKGKEEDKEDEENRDLEEKLANEIEEMRLK